MSCIAELLEQLYQYTHMIFIDKDKMMYVVIIGEIIEVGPVSKCDLKILRFVAMHSPIRLYEIDNYIIVHLLGDNIDYDDEIEKHKAILDEMTGNVRFRA